MKRANGKRMLHLMEREMWRVLENASDRDLKAMEWAAYRAAMSTSSWVIYPIKIVLVDMCAAERRERRARRRPSRATPTTSSKEE